MAQEQLIANLTQHQTITDALLNTMGECMAVQQALLHIPLYDGKNMPLKTFIQDVENGLGICPEGIHNAFFKGVIAKLRDTAREAVSGIEINNIDNLKDALKEYFAPKKTYMHYCAEIQGIRMRRDETVMEYFSRIKRLLEGAKASLREKFPAERVPHMVVMLEGIALESFKRGLSDELLYAVSVQEPNTLDEALRITQRIERDMVGSNDRKGSVRILEAPREEHKDERQHRVHFYEEGRTSTPWRSPSPGRSYRNYSERSIVGESNPDSRSTLTRESRNRYPLSNSAYQNGYVRSPDRNQSQNRRFDRSPNRYGTDSRSSYTNQRTRSPTPIRYPPMSYMPPVPYYNPYQYLPPPPIPYPVYHQVPQYQPPIQRNKNLNYTPARRVDASTSNQTQERPALVKFISAEELMQPKEKDSHQ